MCQVPAVKVCAWRQAGNGDTEDKLPPSSSGMCATGGNSKTKDKRPLSFGGMCATGGNGYIEDKRPISFRRLAAKNAQTGESFFSPAQQVFTKQQTHSVIPLSALFIVDFVTEIIERIMSLK